MAHEYPECTKLAAVSDESQSIGTFIDWLGEMGISLTESRKVSDEFGNKVTMDLPPRDSIEKLLARYFEIDLNKVEVERRHILDNL